MKPENFEPLESNSEIKKSIIKQPKEDAPSPQSKQTVQILYKCRVSDYSVIDENENVQSPFSFTVDTPGVIEGLQIGIKSMKVGERAVFEIPAKYAYGESGSPPRIPANETLYFEAELLNIKNKNSQSEVPKDLPTKLNDTRQLKAEGNEFFKSGKLKLAIQKYDEGIDQLSSEDATDKEVKELLVNLRNNKALLCIKLQSYDECISECDQVLAIDEGNIKALLRKGKGQYLSQHFDDAIDTFKWALEYYPQDKEVITELNFARSAKQKYKKKSKNMFSKMFSEKLYHTADDLEDHQDNPVVFLDIKIGDKEPEKLKLRLFKNIVPKTVENFMMLCKGFEKDGEKLHYKGSAFHRIIKGFMMQGGDFTKGDGTGGKSIYGEKFDDENFEIKHKKRGYLSMANAGPNTNGSQFFILFKDTPHLNGKHVVFGKVIENLNLLDKIENLETEKDKPIEDVVIINSGVCTN